MLRTIVKTSSCSSKTIIREHVKPVFHVNKQENIESLAVNILRVASLKPALKRE
jgi:hypothetical protein